MNFYSVRDLRTRSSDIWETLARSGEAIITNNGKPTALLVNLREDNFEEVLDDLQQLKALRMFKGLRKQAAARGFLTDKEINAEIKAYRAEKKGLAAE